MPFSILLNLTQFFNHFFDQLSEYFPGLSSFLFNISPLSLYVTKSIVHGTLPHLQGLNGTRQFISPSLNYTRRSHGFIFPCFIQILFVFSSTCSLQRGQYNAAGICYWLLWFQFSTWTSSVTTLALYLIAFTRATLVVVCRGENSTAILSNVLRIENYCFPTGYWMQPITECAFRTSSAWS